MQDTWAAARPTTDFERQWGIPADGPPLTGPNVADRAVIARRKANERRHIAAIAGTIEYVHPKPDLSGMLPEAAIEWPIYAAGYRQSTEDCQSYGHNDPLYEGF